MSTSNTKLNDLCDNLEGCKLDVERKISDEELFKQPPPLYDDCPICFERMPIIPTGSKYKSCCGTLICSGCIYAPVYDDQGNVIVEQVCAFCRAPFPSTLAEVTEREMKRMEVNDAQAIQNLGCNYREGACGFTQDYKKALELFHRAAELGCVKAYTNISNAYNHGEGVEVDIKKTVYYYKLAAMKGDVMARCNLGTIEEHVGNEDRALKHYLIAAKGGYSKSLKRIQILYLKGHATKEEYTRALRLYQEYLSEIKSDQRDKAAAAHERYRYY